MKKFLLFLLVPVLLCGAAAFAIWKWCPDTVAAGYVSEYGSKAFEMCKGWFAASKEFAAEAWNRVQNPEPRLPPKDEKAEPEAKPEDAEPQEEKAVENPAPRPSAPKPVVSGPPGWTGIEPDNWCAGLKIKPDSLKRKIVLVFEFSTDDEISTGMLPRIQQVWSAYNTKPFVVLGSHRGDDSRAAAAAAKKAGVSFPVYQGAGWSREPRSSELPFIYLVDDSGKVIYRGQTEHGAIEAFVNALPDVGRRR